MTVKSIIKRKKNIRWSLLYEEDAEEVAEETAEVAEAVAVADEEPPTIVNWPDAFPESPKTRTEYQNEEDRPRGIKNSTQRRSILNIMGVVPIKL